MNRDDAVAITELPAFHSLHQRFVFAKVSRGLRCAMDLDVTRTCEEFSAKGTDTSRDQVRLLETTHAYGAIESFSDEIDEAIAEGRVDLKVWMPFCQHRKYRGEVRWSKGQRGSNA